MLGRNEKTIYFDEVKLIDEHKVIRFRRYVKKNGLQDFAQIHLVMNRWQKGIEIFLKYHDFCPDAMKYVLKDEDSTIFQTYLKCCELSLNDQTTLVCDGNIENLRRYITWGYTLGDKAETALIDKKCEDLLRKYVVMQRTLCENAENRLVIKGEKNLVKWYIDQFGLYITSKSLVYKRGDTELVEAMKKSYKPSVSYQENAHSKNF